MPQGFEAGAEGPPTRSPGTAAIEVGQDSPVRKLIVLFVILIYAATACADEKPAPPADEASEEGPAAPVGTYSAQIPYKEFLPEFDYTPRYFGGRWTIDVQDGQYVLEATKFRITEDFEMTAEGFAIDATPAPTGAFNCFNEQDTRMTGEGQASGLYEVEQTAEGVTFTAVEEPCPLRQRILERSWKKT